MGNDSQSWSPVRNKKRRRTQLAEDKEKKKVAKDKLEEKKRKKEAEAKRAEEEAKRAEEEDKLKREREKAHQKQLERRQWLQTPERTLSVYNLWQDALGHNQYVNALTRYLPSVFRKVITEPGRSEVLKNRLTLPASFFPDFWFVTVETLGKLPVLEESFGELTTCAWPFAGVENLVSVASRCWTLKVTNKEKQEEKDCYQRLVKWYFLVFSCRTVAVFRRLPAWRSYTVLKVPP